VRVHDRDPAVSATGGYRLHLDERACAALRRHLAPAHFQPLLASSAGPAAFRQFAITDHRLRLLGLERQDRRRSGCRSAASRCGGCSLTASARPCPSASSSRTPHAGPALAFAPGGVGAFLSLHDPTGTPAVDPATCQEVTAEVEPPLLVWGLIASDRLLLADLRDRTAAGLVDISGDLLAGWSGDVRALVAAAEVSSVASYRFRATDPEAALTPWPAGPVTCLGDAVHAMPPTGGMAAAPRSATPTCSPDTRPAARLAARGTFPAAALAARAYRTVTGRDQPVPLP